MDVGGPKHRQTGPCTQCRSGVLTAIETSLQVTLDPRLNDPRFFWRFETASAGPPSTVSEANVSGAIVLRDAYGRYLSVTSTDRLKFEATRGDRALFFVEKTSEGRVVLKGEQHIPLSPILQLNDRS